MKKILLPLVLVLALVIFSGCEQVPTYPEVTVDDVNDAMSYLYYPVNANSDLNTAVQGLSGAISVSGTGWTYTATADGTSQTWTWSNYDLIQFQAAVGTTLYDSVTGSYSYVFSDNNNVDTVTYDMVLSGSGPVVTVNVVIVYTADTSTNTIIINGHDMSDDF